MTRPTVHGSSGVTRRSGERARAMNETAIMTGIPRSTRMSRVVAGWAILLVGGVMTSSAFVDFARAEAPATRARLDLGLLEASTLSRESNRWTLLDARPPAEFAKGHLPGARSFSWEEHTRPNAQGVPYQLLPATEIAGVLGAMGITEETPIVVYGDADQSWGGEGWTCWVLERIGHRGPVRLLTGGIEAWRAQGFALETSEPGAPPQASVYRTSESEALSIETEALRRNPDAYAIVDTRSTREWALGRISGAVHIPWEQFFDGDDNRPLSPDALRALLSDRGVKTERPVVYYCAAGVRSAYAWLVHDLSGLPPALNYEGGMEEWTRTK